MVIAHDDIREKLMHSQLWTRSTAVDFVPVDVSQLYCLEAGGIKFPGFTRLLARF